MRLGTIVVLLIAYCGISFAQTSPQTSLDDIRKRTEDIVNRSREANAQVIETLKLGIVRVESQKDANDNDVGTGIVISYSPERILILTALHVVKGAKNVQVVFYSDRSSRVPAQKLPRHSDALDLAVLEVRPAADLRIPSIPPYHFTLSNTLQLGARVWTADGNWTPVPNTITRLDHNADVQKFEYTDVSVGKGFSGGPIFDDYMDIIGMHDALNGSASAGDSAAYAVAVKIDFALQTLEALDYNVPKAGPIALFQAQQAVQPSVTGSTGPANPLALPASPPSQPKPCEQGCEAKIADLKVVQQYHTKQQSSYSTIDITETVYQLPLEWPGRFLHRVSGITAKYASAAPRRIDMFYIAATDRAGDKDCVVYPQGMCTSGTAIYRYKLFGPLGQSPDSIEVHPFP